MNKHTPGPWAYVDHEYETCEIMGQNSQRVCDVWCTDFPDGAANARLIAAAPEMYDVLRQIQSLRDRANSDEGFSDDEGEDVEQAMDAILAKIDNA